MRWLIAFTLFMLAACGPRDIDARPALWRVQDGNTEIWLLGTIHALPPEVQWQTRAIQTAIAQADTLVTEIPPADPTATSAAFLKQARATGLPPLAERVTSDHRAALAPFGTTLDGMKTWAAAVMIAGRGMQAANASATHGLEAVLTAAFSGRPHLALETQSGQLAIFDALPEAAQRVLLTRALEDPDGYAKTLAAWSAGDTNALAASFEPAFRGAPDLQRMLVTERNARWSAWIARRMAKPGRVLVAVGAGHLVGSDSVIAMLEARGLKVDRVQ